MGTEGKAWPPRPQPREKRSAAPAAVPTEFLVFRLGEQHFATPLAVVREVIDTKVLLPVPNSLPHVLGIADLRGQIVSVVDLSQLLGAENTLPSKATLILETQTGPVGGVVQDLHGVVGFSDREIMPEPGTKTHDPSSHTLGVARLDTTLVTLVDLSHLLSHCALLRA